MNIINKITGIVTVCSLLLCMAGRAQDISFPADSCEKINMGFHSMSKTSVTGSVAIVSGESLTKPVSRLSMSLAGQLTGLNTLETNSELTRAMTDMIIRGYSTVNGTTPLIIVDGIICSNSIIEFMFPEEIESIAILKDGASNAIYGIQGANGAIVITTKRGAAGKAKVNVWYHHSLQQMTKRPQLAGSAEYARLRNEAGVNNGLQPFSQFTQDQINKFVSGADPLYPDNNWYNMLVYKISSMQQAGISTQGGTEKVKYYSHINYLHQSSPFIVTDEADRKYDPSPTVNMAKIRTNFDVKFNNYLSGFLMLNGAMNIEKSTQYANSDIYTRIMRLPPTMYGPLTPEEKDDDGEITPGSNQVVTYDGEEFPVYGMLNRSGYNRSLTSSVQAQTGLTLDMGFLTKGLSLTGMMAYHMYGVNTTQTFQDFERYLRSNNYSDLQFSKYGASINSPLVYGKSSAFYYNLSLSARADYLNTFGDHTVQAATFYYYSKQEKEDLLGAGILPYLNEMVGVTAMYGYRDKYFVKADIGYSGSEQFHPDRRYIATPAISAAWIVSKEGFLSGTDWLSLLKLRASYGVNANDQLGGDRYLYTDNIRSNGNETLRGNPLLSAEKIKKQNYGIDLGLFSSVSLSVDYFFHRLDNMLVSSGLIPKYQTIPLNYYPKLNNGIMENRGIEIDAGYYGRLSQDVSVFANAGFSFARNKVIKINELPYIDRGYPLKAEGFCWQQPWGFLIDYSNGNGMFNSQNELAASGLTYSSMVSPRVGDFIYQDLNNDKVIDEGDLAPIGYPRIPEIYYNVRGGLQWKNFDLSILLQGVANASVTVSGAGAYESTAQGVFSDLHSQAWTPERNSGGGKINYPALSLVPSSNHVANSFFIMDASYLKLRNIEIGYSLPESLARKMQAENIRFSLGGQNLFTIDRMRSKYIDPETGTMDRFQPYRVYSVSIKCIF